MRAISLDYQHSHRAWGWPDILLLVGGLAAAAYVGVRYLDMTAEIASLEAEQATFERQSKRSTADSRLTALDAQQLRSEVKQANDVLAKLALPWETLFKDIESSQKDHVALLAIEPDSEKRIIEITGEAKDLDAMLGYLRFLQKKESLTGVYLRSHHVEQQAAEKPVRFVLVASWVIRS
jgi:Tfp pilus assembly protein PilN